MGAHIGAVVVTNIDARQEAHMSIMIKPSAALAVISSVDLATSLKAVIKADLTAVLDNAAAANLKVEGIMPKR